ncbi:SUKH-4 family immunity protein [Kitasatospora sp. NPDC008115]|uniref:SUKH-4 family immunity protein n=1 Tax=Kitasatospora sp. NPDC008115 TaxID=3364022 RepID=UPI0036E79A3C
MRIDWGAVAEGAPMLRFGAEAAAELWQDDAEAVRFVTEVGVPSNGLFRLLEELAERPAEDPGRAFARPLSAWLVETEHGRLRQLGELYGGFVFLNLDDGTIWVCDPDADEEYELIHRDISSLAYLVYKIEVEKPSPGERPTPHDWADAEEFVREGMNRWDETPFGDGTRFWEAFMDSYHMT